MFRAITPCVMDNQLEKKVEHKNEKKWKLDLSSGYSFPKGPLEVDIRAPFLVWYNPSYNP